MATTNESARQRVHNLLFAYAKKHLTIDHVQYSINIFRLLRPFFFKEVPLHGQNTFILPLDPFDVLFSQHSCDQLPRYEERFKANQEAVQLLKEYLRTRTGTPKTERVLQEDDNDLQSPTEWLCPILTRSSIGAGLVQGRPVPLNTVPKSYNAVIGNAGIKPVLIEVVEEAEVPYERTLKVLWVMKSEERDAIRDLLKHVTDIRRPQPNYKNATLHAFLNGDDSTTIAPSPEEEFVPIFHRSRRIGRSSVPAHEQSLQELIELVPEACIASDDSDMFIANASLEIVDGWHTLKVSSPLSVATPTSSQEDNKIDQLFLEDSPPTEPVSGFMSGKMEEIEIPRSRRIGGTYGRKAHILHRESIATFLPPLVRAKAVVESTDKTPPHNSSPTPESLLGHASVDTENISNDTHSDNLDAYIKQLCPNEHPHDIIMKVQIEDEGTSIFMEAPQLRPPNVHASESSLVLPAKISDLTEDTHTLYSRRPLKKASRGLPALTLSLSWVTFTTDTPLPSHQEISGVSKLFHAALACDDVDRLIQRSLLEGTPAHDARPVIPEVYFELPLVKEQDPGPYIAISRRHRKGEAQGSDSLVTTPEHPKANVRRSSGNNPGTREPEQMNGYENFDAFSCESSVLQFESTGARLFDDPAKSDSVYQTPLNTLEPIENVVCLDMDGTYSATDERHTGNPDGDSNLVGSGLVDPPFLGICGPINPLQPDSLCASRLVDFTCLRAKQVRKAALPPPVVDLPPSSSPISGVLEDLATTIQDPSSLVLPESSHDPKSPHRYMASMDFVQRQVVVRALRASECMVDLAERTSLGGVDAIVDPFSSIVVASLFTLPAHGKKLVSRIWEQSWRFQHILVLLEAYPETLALRPPRALGEVQKVSAYTPPILKSIRKLRRDVVIGGACGKKREECNVWYALADDTMTAAKLVRYFGDLAEERDTTNGLLWRTREWLDLEIYPDEGDLSQLQGMNCMSASILLCQATPEEILDMLPEERLEVFGPLIGFDALQLLNKDLEARLGRLDFAEHEAYSRSESGAQ